MWKMSNGTPAGTASGVAVGRFFGESNAVAIVIGSIGTTGEAQQAQVQRTQNAGQPLSGPDSSAPTAQVSGNTSELTPLASAISSARSAMKRPRGIRPNVYHVRRLRAQRWLRRESRSIGRVRRSPRVTFRVTSPCQNPLTGATGRRPTTEPADAERPAQKALSGKQAVLLRFLKADWRLPPFIPHLQSGQATPKAWHRRPVPGGLFARHRAAACAVVRRGDLGPNA